MTQEERVMDRENAVQLLSEAKKRVFRNGVLIYIRADTYIVSEGANRDIGFIRRYFRRTFGRDMTERELREACLLNRLAAPAGGV